MRRIATLVLIVVSFCGTALCQHFAEFRSYYSGKRYDFRVTRDQLTSTPAWLDGEPNPPLSARSAKDIAAIYMRDLFSDGSSWRVREIALQPVGERWIYLISFDPRPPPGCADCFFSPFKIVVLMNGVAVTATKSDWMPQTP